ncbi:MAG: hypothetical protein HY454_03365 [Parcubacteria group bacterium]|nr:hypothetical protein [Parcubacteria group bacterium]
MLKFLLYTTLFSLGGYYLATNLPDSVKQKALAALGLGRLKDKSFEIFNPAARRAELLEKLGANADIMESLTRSIASGNASPDETAQLESALQESQKIIEEIKELNPKSSLLPQIVGKIAGVGSSPAPPPSSNGPSSLPALSQATIAELQNLISKLSPEDKAAVCQAP